jgi:hypothetical protein
LLLLLLLLLLAQDPAVDCCYEQWLLGCAVDNHHSVLLRAKNPSSQKACWAQNRI